MLYKAFTSDMKSPEGYGVPFGPWVKDQWYEIEGPVHFDSNGVTGPVPNGFFCSPDLIQTTFSVKTEFICEVETDGASVVYENNQWWQKMRVVTIKAWPPTKAALILDWAEGRAHDVWAGRFTTEAETYAAKQYQGQWADMLEVIQPVYKSLYADNDFYLFPKIHQFNTLKPEYTRQFECLVRLAYNFCAGENRQPHGLRWRSLRQRDRTGEARVVGHNRRLRQRPLGRFGRSVTA